ncbi:MAG TPA: hypothetical protein VF469_27780, partial [Kofleriaceae bacterium]
WDAALVRCRQLLADPDPSVVQLGAVLDSRLAGWRLDQPGATAAAARFVQRVEQAARLLAVFQRASQTGEIDVAQWSQLEQLFTRTDRPRRMQIMGLQLMAELSIVAGHPDLGLRALRRAAEAGLIDITWLDRCPLLQPFAGDPRWRAVRDEIARRAARMLAAFRAAAG